MLDASAALAALLNDGPARRMVAVEQLHAPHLVDSEVASGLRRGVAGGRLTVAQASDALRVWQQLGVTRYPGVGLLDRVWELREDVTAHDATYVALAEVLDCALVTADARLSRAPALGCPLTVVPA